MELTRRHVLTAAAGVAAAPLLPAISADAAAPMADKQAPSFYRYKVGDIQVTVISDGVNTFALGDSFFFHAKVDFGLCRVWDPDFPALLFDRRFDAAAGATGGGLSAVIGRLENAIGLVTREELERWRAELSRATDDLKGLRAELAQIADLKRQLGV